MHYFITLTLCVYNAYFNVFLSGERNVKYKELKKREETMDGTPLEIVQYIVVKPPTH